MQGYVYQLRYLEMGYYCSLVLPLVESILSRFHQRDKCVDKQQSCVKPIYIVLSARSALAAQLIVAITANISALGAIRVSSATWPASTELTTSRFTLKQVAGSHIHGSTTEWRAAFAAPLVEGGILCILIVLFVVCFRLFVVDQRDGKQANIGIGVKLLYHDNIRRRLVNNTVRVFSDASFSLGQSISTNQDIGICGKKFFGLSFGSCSDLHVDGGSSQCQVNSGKMPHLGDCEDEWKLAVGL